MSRICRWAFSLAAATVALTLSPAPSLAWSSFCEDDPPVQAVTPAGRNVTINNFVTYERENLGLMRQATLYATTEPAGPGRTLVVIHVLTPGGGVGSLQIRSSTERFQQQTAAEGGWGEEIRLYMILDIA